MQRTVLFATLALASGLALAQNVAVVNGKPIPKAREDAWVKELTKQGQPDSPELRKMVKERLIQNEVLLQEATKRGIPDKPDVKFMLDVQRQNTLIQALLRDEMTKHPVTDAEVQAEYDKQKSMVGGKEFRARHILVENEAEATAIVDQLKKGAKFEELAKKSKDTGSASNGGDLDWAAPDAYVKPFSDAMQKLKKGEMTEVAVKTQFGWHIILLEDTREAQFPEFADVKPQIVQRLEQIKLQNYQESLRAAAKTDYKFLQ